MNAALHRFIRTSPLSAPEGASLGAMAEVALAVEGLCKQYPSFTLSDVSFSLPAGQITGFIGRNGAGKTTTLKSLLGFVHPDRGEIRFFGERFAESELAIKQRIGFVSGGVDYYAAKRLRVIADVTRRFYDRWDEAAYRACLDRFHLDENKTVAQLSAGMRVKFALALALSHNAELLLLDEPTSGLDPVSRDELLDAFLSLRDRGVTILFSTHITSDLDHCADRILYLRGGRIRADEPLDAFVKAYRVAHLTAEQAQSDALGPLLTGVKRARDGCTALVRAADAAALPCPVYEADLEAIMVHMEREEDC